MSNKTKANSSDEEKLMKEIKIIKNLLMLSVLHAGATSEQVDYATGMGAANIRRLFPIKRGRRKN